MSRRRGLKSRLHRVSHSFLSSATACPLRGFWEGIVEIPVPQSPPAVLGQAMHYMFQQFFSAHRTTKRFPYQEEQKLLGAFTHFWWGAVKGDHGFHGRGTTPSSVAWSSDSQAGELFARGMKHLKQFFARADPLRSDPDVEYRVTERRATAEWQGLTVTGVFDRIDVGTFQTIDGQRVTGARIVDYKPSEYADHQVTEGTQFSIYQWLYEVAIRKTLVGRPPLVQMQVHNYGRDQISDVPLRAPEMFDQLRQLMGSVVGYYLAIIHNAPAVHQAYPFFDLEDLERRVISPKLPRGYHCTYCGFVAECQRYAKMSDREKYHVLRQQLEERFGSLPGVGQLDLGLERPPDTPGPSAASYLRLQNLQPPPQIELELQ